MSEKEIQQHIHEQMIAVNKTVKRVLDMIETGDSFQRFSIARHQITSGFLDLLKALEGELEESDLKHVIQNNIYDETGMSKGEYDVKADHAAWRSEYLSGLGIQEEVSAPTAQAYNTTLQSLIHAKDSEQMLGALLFLEASIPGEFAFIKKKRNELFPDLSAEAKKYIDDHIIHDAEVHFPELMKALPNNLDVKKTIVGIDTIVNAKKHFYEHVEMNIT